MSTYRLLVIQKKGELPRQKKTLAEFAEGLAAADSQVEDGAYAAGLKLTVGGRVVAEWSYLTSKEHGPTIPAHGDRRRKNKRPSTPLPMKGNPVGEGAKGG